MDLKKQALSDCMARFGRAHGRRRMATNFRNTVLLAGLFWGVVWLAVIYL